MEKQWTILFYLNGNNELEPEMAKSKLVIENEGSNDKVDVLIQFSGIEKRVVEIIRPQCRISGNREDYTGVSRYHVTTPFGDQAEELGNINMADPKCLYEFVEWGMKNYPAKHYMLILGGHVFQYVGVMPDYSQGLPYLMSFPGMVDALSQVKKSVGKGIELLILDACYVNRIETLYELGKEKEPPVSTVMTYISGGPVSGLPYDIIIKKIKECSDKTSFLDLMKKTLQCLNYDLILYEVNHTKLEELKGLFSNIAYSCLNSHTPVLISPAELLTSLDSRQPWHNQLEELHKKMPCLTICYRSLRNLPISHFYISTQKIDKIDKADLYCKLAFAKNNYWTQLICASLKAENNQTGDEHNMEPIVLKPENLYALISAMNPDLSTEQNKQILFELISYKGWSWG